MNKAHSPAQQVGLVSLLSLYTIAIWTNPAILWGGGVASYLPTAVKILLTVIPFAIAIPKLRESIWSKLSAFNPNALAAGTVLGTAGLLLGFVLPESIPLLGDGNLRANEILDGRSYQPTELLDFYIHALAFREIFGPLGYSVTDTYRVISALASIPFGVGVILLARRIAPDQLLVNTIVLIASGTVVLFFGYIESYSLVAAIMPFALLAGLRYFDTGSGLSLFIALFLFAGIVHSVGAVLLLPLLIVSVVRAFGIQVGTKRFRAVILLGAAVLVVAGYIGRAFDLPVVTRYLLPLIDGSNQVNELLSLGHIRDTINILLLSALPACLLLGLTVVASRTNSEVNDRSTYAVALLISGFMFILFFTPELGAPLDWDLLSLGGWIIIPGAIILYRERTGAGLPNEVLPIVTVGLLIALSFGIVNHYPTLAAERYVDLLEVDAKRNRYLEYATLARLSQNYPDVQDRQLEFAVKAWEEPPRNLADSHYISLFAAQQALSRNDRETAQQFISVDRSLDTLDINSYRLYADYIERYTDVAKLAALADEVDRRFPDDPQGQLEAGIMYMKAGREIAGGEKLTAAWQLDSTQFWIQYNYGNYLLKQGDYAAAKKPLHMAVRNHPDHFGARSNLALALYYAGDIERAREQLRILSGQAVTTRQQLRLEQLNEVIR